MKRQRQRPRWEVRHYAFNALAHSCGLPVTTQLLRVSTYRWRWLAELVALTSYRGFMGIVCWAEVERARPKLRAVDSPEGAVSVLKAKATEETGADRPAAAISLVCT